MPMSLQGPVVIIAEEVDPILVQALESTGAAPVVETRWIDAADVVAATEPAGIVVPQVAGAVPPAAIDRLADVLAEFQVYTPLLAVPSDDIADIMPEALPLSADASCDGIAARLAAAQAAQATQAVWQRERERMQNRLDAQRDAIGRWQRATPADPAHPYLKQKRVAAHGLRHGIPRQ